MGMNDRNRPKKRTFSQKEGGVSRLICAVMLAV
jgi:hypothetical protein